MTKEFIPYEQALVLNELGFDEPCLAFYNLFFEASPALPTMVFQENTRVNKCYWLCNTRGNFSSIPDEYISAPLYQQVFKWFMDKHNLDSEIYMNHELGVKFYTYLILQLDRAVITHKSGYDGKFYSYEEAELECIKKLIEIVKNKK